MKTLLDSDKDIVNARDREGLTPLHCALLLEVDNKVVELLLKRGADMNIRDNEGNDCI